jgi:hypothetical protein
MLLTAVCAKLPRDIGLRSQHVMIQAPAMAVLLLSPHPPLKKE